MFQSLESWWSKNTIWHLNNASQGSVERSQMWKNWFNHSTFHSAADHLTFILLDCFCFTCSPSMYPQTSPHRTQRHWPSWWSLCRSPTTASSSCWRARVGTRLTVAERKTSNLKPDSTPLSRPRSFRRIPHSPTFSWASKLQSSLSHPSVHCTSC